MQSLTIIASFLCNVVANHLDFNIADVVIFIFIFCSNIFKMFVFESSVVSPINVSSREKMTPYSERVILSGRDIASKRCDIRALEFYVNDT